MKKDSMSDQEQDPPEALFNVIRAKLKHVQIVAPLFDAYRQFYNQPSDLQRAYDYLYTRVSKDESVIFVAVKGATALGFTQLYPTFSSISLKSQWILNDLYVDSSARQLGVATALMEQARAFAIETQAKGLMLQTATDNKAAQALYEKLGWKNDTEFFTYYLNL
jgi:ribosomal protein S18 acetylase RimI-like enzyme